MLGLYCCYLEGLWDPDEIPVEDLVRACLLLLEIGIMQPKLQIVGGTGLLDCEGLTMKHMRQFSPSVAMQIMNIMVVSTYVVVYCETVRVSTAILLLPQL